MRDALNNANTYSFETINGRKRMRGQNQPAGAGCASMTANLTYHSTGEVATHTDFSGRMTGYTYDTLHTDLVTQKDEALDYGTRRRTSTEWHPQLRLPKRIATPKLLTTYDYYPNGKLRSVSEQSTTDETGKSAFTAQLVGEVRSWHWTYNQFNQVLTATGPRVDKVDTTIYTYDALGNLSTVTNSAGHLTKFEEYTLDGDVGRITDANNRVTKISYTPLRQIDKLSVTDGKTIEVTDYDYYATGLLKRITLPDNSYLHYVYDDAQRLTSIQDMAGNLLRYVYDEVSNLKREEVQDSGRKLLQLVRREYDALRHIKQLQLGQPETKGQGFSETYDYAVV